MDSGLSPGSVFLKALDINKRHRPGGDLRHMAVPFLDGLEGRLYLSQSYELWSDVFLLQSERFRLGPCRCYLLLRLDLYPLQVTLGLESELLGGLLCLDGLGELLEKEKLRMEKSSTTMACPASPGPKQWSCLPISCDPPLKIADEVKRRPKLSHVRRRAAEHDRALADPVDEESVHLNPLIN
jgi:hypothetical protein